MAHANYWFFASFLICLSFFVGPTFGEETVSGNNQKEKVSYYKQVRPIFQAHCQGCHQPAKKLGDYLMTSFDALVAGGESGDAAIVPGKPDESYLVGQITSVDGTAEMPKKADPLGDKEIALIRKWIEQGATNDTPPSAAKSYTSENPPEYTRPPVVTSLDYSPDGKLLAVSGFHEVLLLSTENDNTQPIARLVGMSPRIESVRFSPDGKRLAAVGGTAAINGEVQIWNVEDKNLELSLPVGFDTIYGASWSPDGKFLAFGCADSSVRAIDAMTGKQVLFQGSHNDWVMDTIFSKDGSHLISVGRDMTAKLIEVETQRFVDNITSITPKALKGGILSVVRHPNRDSILFGGADGVPKIYQMHRTTARKIGDDANLKWELPPLPGRIFGVDFSNDASKIVAGSSLDGNGAVHVYGIDPDYKVPKDINDILVKPTHTRSGDERSKLAKYFEDGITTISKLSTNAPIYAVAFSPDGSRVAASGGDGKLRIIDTADGNLLQEFVPVKIREASLASESLASLDGTAKKPTLELTQLGEGQIIESILVEPADITFGSPSEYNQVLVTATLTNGDSVDVSRLVTYSVDSGVAKVTESGLVTAAADGRGQLMATIGDHSSVSFIEVAGISETTAPDYIRDVMPVISRMGCNAGTCHGSKDGKNGFKLSLRGYDPIYDIRAFTDDIGSRRVNVAAPENSLILEKCTAAVPHEGGQLTNTESQYYRIVRDWIANGAKLDLDSAKVKSISVSPTNPVVQQVGSRQQIRVVATYADGKQRDVTREAFIESGNIDILKAVKGHAGLVQVERRGEAALLVRFEGNYAATTITVMGDRNGFQWQEPPANGPIDQFVSRKLERTKTLPSPLCDDYEFVRRVHLDLTGLPPTTQVIRSFVDDKRDSRWKRDELIDQLIGSEAFVDHWANKWADLLQVNSKFLGGDGAKRFRGWIRDRVAENMPYDDFVRAILTANGSNYDNPAASYFKILRTPEDTMENTTHLFLATRFNCNKCHDHPFERWTQDQYYEMSAFFAQVGLKKDDRSGNNKIGQTAVESGKPLYEVVFDKGDGEVKHERTGAVTAPATPYKASNKSAQAPTRREALADWITSPDNQYFAKSYVNRLWGYLTGTGIIEPIDDIRAGNPPTNPELLEYLTKRFIEKEFNVREIIREICKSRTYQLSVASNEWNDDDTLNYSHAKARRLPAEVLYDAIQTVTGSQSKFPNVPAGTRAAALPDVGIKLPDGFLGNLGRPARESACECERSNDVQLGPVMALVSGPTVGEALAGGENALADLVSEFSDDKELFNELFLRILNRPATETELKTALETLNILEQEHKELESRLAQSERNWKPVAADLEVKRWQKIGLAERELNQYLAKTKEAREKAVHQREKKIEAAETALAKYERNIDQHIDEWSKLTSQATEWQVVTFDSMTSTFGAKLERLDDGSLFASEKNARGNYDLVASSDLNSISGIRIEALTDERLPKNGPGRADDGNFVLSELKFQWADVSKNKETEVASWQLQKSDGEWKGNDQVALQAGDEYLTITSKGDDPQLQRDVEAVGRRFMLEVEAKLSGNAETQLFWRTKKKNGVAEDRSVKLTLTGQDRWLPYRYYFNAGDDLTGLRFDPSVVGGTKLEVRKIKLVRIDGPQFMDLKLVDAQADFSQKEYSVADAIDGKNNDNNDGWAVSPQAGKPHQAVFRLEKPLETDMRKQLKFTLMQNYRGNKFSLGRFRVSVTSSPAPLDFGLPKGIAQILAQAVDNRTEDDQNKLREYFRSSDQAMRKLRDTLAKAKMPLPEDPEFKRLEGIVAARKQPIKEDTALVRLRSYVKASDEQVKNKRLTAAQDVAWALINNPAFLFNH